MRLWGLLRWSVSFGGGGGAADTLMPVRRHQTDQQQQFAERHRQELDEKVESRFKHGASITAKQEKQRSEDFLERLMVDATNCATSR